MLPGIIWLVLADSVTYWAWCGGVRGVLVLADMSIYGACWVGAGGCHTMLLHTSMLAGICWLSLADSVTYWAWCGGVRRVPVLADISIYGAFWVGAGGCHTMLLHTSMLAGIGWLVLADSVTYGAGVVGDRVG